jgi:hypothetical protein
VIKKPRERGGHSPRWAAKPEEEEEEEEEEKKKKIIIVFKNMFVRYFVKISELDCSVNINLTGRGDMISLPRIGSKYQEEKTCSGSKWKEPARQNVPQTISSI